MWVSGAHGKGNRETGILEELNMENYYRNPYRTFPVWDNILFEAVKQEKNITSILNCSCNDCKMDGDTILSVTGLLAECAALDSNPMEHTFNICIPIIK